MCAGRGEGGRGKPGSKVGKMQVGRVQARRSHPPACLVGKDVLPRHLPNACPRQFSTNCVIRSNVVCHNNWEQQRQWEIIKGRYQRVPAGNNNQRQTTTSTPIQFNCSPTHVRPTTTTTLPQQPRGSIQHGEGGGGGGGKKRNRTNAPTHTISCKGETDGARGRKQCPVTTTTIIRVGEHNACVPSCHDKRIQRNGVIV